MKEKFTKYLSICMVIAMAVMIVFIFGLQTFTATASQRRVFQEKLDSVEVKIQENEKQIASLTENLDATALAKTRAFAYMIQKDPAILENQTELNRICKLLDADELHVTDEKGILTYGTVPEIFGFDFAGGEQTIPFMDILKDSSLQIAQEPQINATRGTLFQYTGIARYDAPGIVQIGVTPKVLEELLENNRMQNVISGVEVGNSGYAFAIRTADGMIEGFPVAEYLDKPCLDAGFPKEIVNQQQSEETKFINGTKVFYQTRQYGEYIIGTAIPTSEMFQVRTSQTLIFAASVLVIFLILIVLIRMFLSRIVVNDITHVIGKLDDIRGGNLDTVVELRRTRESEQLSDSINSMTASIRQSIRENEQSAAQNEQLLQQQNKLFDDIRTASESIADFSEKTSEISRSIHSGTLEQSSNLERLQQVMENLTRESRESSGVSENASRVSDEAVRKMEEANGNMQEMMEAMKQIAATSEKIEFIIKNIDEIAEQTNLLALNASIEAARAGAEGRGFAVVADQVGVLAKQSTEAAAETNQLIQNSLQAIRTGNEKAEKAIDVFREVVENSRKTGDAVKELYQTSQRQAKLVEMAERGMEDISRVVEDNVSISVESENAAEELAGQAEQLKVMVH